MARIKLGGQGGAQHEGGVGTSCAKSLAIQEFGGKVGGRIWSAEC